MQCADRYRHNTSDETATSPARAGRPVWPLRAPRAAVSPGRVARAAGGRPGRQWLMIDMSLCGREQSSVRTVTAQNPTYLPRKHDTQKMQGAFTDMTPPAPAELVYLYAVGLGCGSFSNCASSFVSVFWCQPQCIAHLVVRLPELGFNSCVR